jgi:hypothetical protein
VAVRLGDRLDRAAAVNAGVYDAHGNELLTFEHVLALLLTAAAHWRVVEVPAGKAVVVAGYAWKDNAPAADAMPGIAVVMDADPSRPEGAVVVRDLRIEHCAIEYAAEQIVQLAREAVEQHEEG